MLLLLEKIIKNQIEKNPIKDFSLIPYLQDIYETDSTQLQLNDRFILIDSNDKFILNIDTQTVSWLKEVFEQDLFFKIYNLLDVFQKITFITICLDNILFTDETLFLDFLDKTETDLKIRKQIKIILESYKEDGFQNYIEIFDNGNESIDI